MINGLRLKTRYKIQVIRGSVDVTLHQSLFQANQETNFNEGF